MKPDFCSVGPHILAFGMNNRVWYYQYDKEMEKSVLEIHKQVCNLDQLYPIGFFVLEYTFCTGQKNLAFSIVS